MRVESGDQLIIPLTSVVNSATTVPSGSAIITAAEVSAPEFQQPRWNAMNLPSGDHSGIWDPTRPSQLSSGAAILTAFDASGSAT